jgi:hypothetical protein
MNIEGLRRLQQTRSASAVRRAGKPGEAFADLLLGAGEADEASAPKPVAASSGIAALLAVQEADSATERASRGKARAEDLLAELDKLKVGLLTGRLDKAGLERLVALAASRRPSIDDSRLTAVLDEIDLRAQVELAKLSY